MVTYPRNRTVPLVTGVVGGVTNSNLAIGVEVCFNLLHDAVKRMGEPILYFFIIYYNTFLVICQVFAPVQFLENLGNFGAAQMTDIKPTMLAIPIT